MTDSFWLPKVSIIIPVYNGVNYMKEAINSALNQTYSNIEVIVVNDGSTDNGETGSVALSYGDKIKYLEKSNGGVSSALNLGIKHMTGEYFSWLSHDDVYTPYKIENQINSLKEYGSKNAIAMCSHFFIDDRGEKLNKTPNMVFKNGCYEWGTALKTMLIKGTFNGCALLIPKDAFDRCGEFHEGLRYSQDSLMWDKIFLAGYSLVYNDNKDVMNRIHNRQLTQTGKTIFKSDSWEISKILMKDLIEASDSKSNFVFYFAERNALNGNMNVVKSCISEGKKHGLICWRHELFLLIQSLYGEIRPILRKLYYKYLIRVKIG